MIYILDCDYYCYKLPLAKIGSIPIKINMVTVINMLQQEQAA